MKLHMQMTWKRNLGRDDRCVADNGKEVARKLKFDAATVLLKRAFEFGSTIPTESNWKNLESNRAANQATAGSALFHPI
ncbi:asparagine synthase family protein [Artemisia annua]|uniref:Asparagine synthase family protein n=1 Tax=Artemisia annua TaxID=35608 RepID=A0A2U1L0C3_ARTAN|nr:asparagine synthase family protein [Artemisia annua]